MVTTLFAFLFVLGVLIFVHELGHFMAARRIGVRVQTFSLGFGPKLLKIRRGDTEYCLSAIPLGGYVKMAGENPKHALSGASDEFLSKSKWQRFQVLVMGPVMNVVLAVLVMAVVLHQGARVPIFEQQPVVIAAFADGLVAAATGLKLGDRIVSVDSRQVETWEQFSNAIAPKARREVTLGIVRDGRRAQITVTPEARGKYGIGNIGVQPPARPQVLGVTKGRPAEEAGLQDGDVVMAAGGLQDVTYEQLLAAITSHPQQPLALTIMRGDRPHDITVTPRQSGDKAMIGAQFSPFETRTVKPGAIDAVKLSLAKNWDWTTQIVQTLGGLFTRETSVSQLMGPVAIANLTGDAIQLGWIQLFTLMAMVSLNLGLFNLSPIPVLDGGHILILAVEGLARRDFSRKVKERMVLTGFAFLLMLMATVIYNDLMRIEWIERLMPWHGDMLG